MMSSLVKLVIIIIVEVKEIFAMVKYLKQLQIKPRKNSEPPTGFEPIRTDTGAMLYRLSYEASPEVGCCFTKIWKKHSPVKY